MRKNECILIVDDDKILCEHLKAGLTSDGYQVVTAYSGAAAVEEIKKQFFNVVAVDLILPDLQGIDLMRTINRKYPDTCFILSTGYATIASAIEALKIGAYDYIIKPFDIDHLRLVIKRGIEKQGLVLRNKELFERLEKEKVKLEIIMEAYTKIGLIYNLEDLADFVTDKALQIVEAEKASLMIVDETSNELVFKGGRGINKERANWRVKVGNLISGWVAKEGKCLLIDDIENDPRFKSNARSADYKSKSLLCVPLKMDTHVVGVINVTDKLADIKIFTEQDLRYLSLLAHQTVTQIENIRLCERLSALAVTDSLTGVFNHRYFQEQLRVEIMRAQRYKHSLSLMMFDIDNFKQYNDYYGHLEGDKILKHVAAIMKDAVRQVDIVCRYGGDEFVVILPYTQTQGAAVVAEKIRKLVERSSLRNERSGKDIGVTVSIGIAAYHANTLKDQVIAWADQALYQSKGSGRNKVTIAKKEG